MHHSNYIWNITIVIKSTIYYTEWLKLGVEILYKAEDNGSNQVQVLYFQILLKY